MIILFWLFILLTLRSIVKIIEHEPTPGLDRDSPVFFGVMIMMGWLWGAVITLKLFIDHS